MQLLLWGIIMLVAGSVVVWIQLTGMLHPIVEPLSRMLPYQPASCSFMLFSWGVHAMGSHRNMRSICTLREHLADANSRQGTSKKDSCDFFTLHAHLSLCWAKRGAWEKEGVHNNPASMPKTTLPGPIGTTHRA